MICLHCLNIKGIPHFLTIITNNVKSECSVNFTLNFIIRPVSYMNTTMENGVTFTMVHSISCMLICRNPKDSVAHYYLYLVHRLVSDTSMYSLYVVSPSVNLSVVTLDAGIIYCCGTLRSYSLGKIHSVISRQNKQCF